MIYFITQKPTLNNNAKKAKKGLFDFLFSKKEEPKAEPRYISNKIGENLPYEGQVPLCKSCDHPMNLIIQIDDERIVAKPTQIFQCQNDPGMCDDWDADAGGNKVIYSDKLQQSYSDQEVALEFVESKYTDEELMKDEGELFYDVCEEEYKNTLIGKVHGEPVWLQSDDTPSCCNQAMTFVLQIFSTNVLNFGDFGEAYLFDCKTCQNGKFLWQSH